MVNYDKAMDKIKAERQENKEPIVVEPKKEKLKVDIVPLIETVEDLKNSVNKAVKKYNETGIKDKITVEFEWDPSKSDENFRRRGFDFAFASQLSGVDPISWTPYSP